MYIPNGKEKKKKQIIDKLKNQSSSINKQKIDRYPFDQAKA